MTATTASGAQANLPMQVRNTTLLGILVLVPAFALTAVIDALFLNHAIRDWMLSDPRQIAYWAAILTVPHIVASLVTFADRDYLAQYKPRLIKGGTIALLLGFGVPFALGPVGVLLVIAFYTMYHNLMQQYGLSLMMCRQPPTLDYHLWRWFTIIPAGVAYTALMASGEDVVISHWDTIMKILAGFLLFATIFGIRLVWTVIKNPQHTRVGLVYLLSNMAILYVCFGLIVTGYGFMATLLPRLTHDLTAFLVYMVHDQNRNAQTVHNPLYALPRKIGLPPALMCAPLALGISYVLFKAANQMFLLSLFITSLNYMHYYMETYMWKRGTLHRQYVPFT